MNRRQLFKYLPALLLPAVAVADSLDDIVRRQEADRLHHKWVLEMDPYYDVDQNPPTQTDTVLDELHDLDFILGPLEEWTTLPR